MTALTYYSSNFSYKLSRHQSRGPFWTVRFWLCNFFNQIQTAILHPNLSSDVFRMWLFKLYNTNVIQTIFKTSYKFGIQNGENVKFLSSPTLEHFQSCVKIKGYNKSRSINYHYRKKKLTRNSFLCNESFIHVYLDIVRAFPYVFVKYSGQ